MTAERRSVPARLGISALNLPAPGLGLLRIGRVRAAIVCGLLPVAALVLMVLYYLLGPPLDFPAHSILFGLVVLALLTSWIGSILLSWRGSAVRERPLPWFSRWYALVGSWVLLTIVANILAEVSRSHYKAFYAAAEGMAPTLEKGDSFVAAMNSADLRRGDVIVFETPHGTYVQRIIGMPGDRIAIAGGVVRLNGEQLSQRFVREESVQLDGALLRARRLLEQLPGERREHAVYDLGYSPAVDDMAEQTIAPRHLFVLGDNRDRSADSRVPREQGGVEQLAIGAVRGKALFFSWQRNKTGRPIS